MRVPFTAPDGGWMRQFLIVVYFLFSTAVLSVFGGCEAEDTPGHQVPIGNDPLAIRVCADGPTIDGVDVSHWQGNIDWNAVATDGIVFAFMKATQGDYFVDSEFARNWAGARDAGIIRGAYHFFCPNQNGTDQADLMLETIGTLEPRDLPPVLDVEWVPSSNCPPCCSTGVSCADMITHIGQWVERIESVTGRTPIIYTARSFWENNVCNASDFNHLTLWIANWEVTCPDIPSAWSDWVFWQTSDSGRVAGISGDVDTDLFNGDMEALEAFLSSRPTCGDGRCSGDEDCSSCPADCGDCPVELEAFPEPEATIDVPTEVITGEDVGVGEEIGEFEPVPEIQWDESEDATSGSRGSARLEGTACSCAMAL